MSGGYVMVPGWFLDLKPGGSELVVYCALARYGRFDTGAGLYEECRPSVATLVTDTRLSESVVHRCLRWLRDAGAILREERYDADGGQAPMVYRVIFGALVGPEGVSPQAPPGAATGTPGGAASDTEGVPPAAPNPEPPTQNPRTQKRTTSKASPSRGTRIPEGFQPDETLKQWFRDQRYGGPAEFWRTEHAKFCDYWTAQSGQRATKADWPATWRNWMRKAAERVPAAGRPTQGGFKNSAEKQADHNARESDLARIGDEVARQWGATGKDYAENLRVRAEAERIYASRVTTCQPSGYTAPDGGDIVDAEWTEHPARREVTAS